MTGNALRQLEEELMIVPCIARTAKLMHVYMSQQFKRFNVPLTPKQWVLLKHLIFEDGQDQKHLALITERDKTSLARLISSMEKKGLVTRQPNPKDKRANFVHITDKGREAFEAAIPITEDVRKIFKEGLDKDELDVALAIIQKLHDHLKELTSQNADD